MVGRHDDQHRVGAWKPAHIPWRVVAADIDDPHQRLRYAHEAAVTDVQIPRFGVVLNRLMVQSEESADTAKARWPFHLN
ncbi:hypothetical protein ACFQV4_01075 [Streptomyces thermocarboxydus]